MSAGFLSYEGRRHKIYWRKKRVKSKKLLVARKLVYDLPGMEKTHWSVAQPVERVAVNHDVGGSSASTPAIKLTRQASQRRPTRRCSASPGSVSAQ